ncbi:hypothetical protein [Streptomyces sp. NPDC055912]|uniref:hypothetical protein n=1 Tax=Streptomyces sp. NPDC055912 TaxID=3345660 RepID=UPI0035E39C2E
MNEAHSGSEVKGWPPLFRILAASASAVCSAPPVDAIVWEMMKFSGQPAVPAAVKSSLQSLIDNRKSFSPQLREFLDLVDGNPTCHLFIDALASGVDEHGSTGVFVSPPQAPQGTLIAEALLLDPQMILAPHESFIKVTVMAGPGTDPGQAAVTLLHELELHVAPACDLLREISQDVRSDDARLGLVLAYLRRPDEHVALDRQEQYVRSAARIRLATVGSSVHDWGAHLMTAACADALEQFAAYETTPPNRVANSVERTRWLAALVEALRSHGPEAVLQAQPPTRPVVHARPAVDGDLSTLVAFRTFQRVDPLDIIDEARTAQGATVLGVLDLYRHRIVPALLAQAGPLGLTDPIQQAFFLTYHGVPGLIAWEACNTDAGTADDTLEDVKVVPAWPPREPVFWLTREERTSWNRDTGIPRSVFDTPGIENGSHLYVDGVKYRAAVADSDRVGETRLFAYGRRYMALRPVR